MVRAVIIVQMEHVVNVVETLTVQVGINVVIIIVVQQVKRVVLMVYAL